MSDNMLTYQGLIVVEDYGDCDDVLMLEPPPEKWETFAETLANAIAGKQVSVRYWVSSKQCTKEEANENFLRHLVGAADAEWSVTYSDVTGYLWHEERCKIGGHDLIAEFKSSVDKWLILEIEIHEGKP